MPASSTFPRTNGPRITPRGAWILKAGILALFIGSIIEDDVMVMLAIFAICLLPISWLLCRFNIRRLRYEATFPLDTFAQRDFDVPVQLANEGRFFDRYSLVISDRLLGANNSLTLPWVRAKQKEGQRVSTRIPNRGIYTEGLVSLSSSFPLGLFEIQHQFQQELDLTVYPSPLLPRDLVGVLSDEEPNADASHRSLPKQQGEFRSLREFRNGDPLKTVDWHATARHQQLMVREFDPHVSEDYVVVFHSYRPEGAIVTVRDFERSMQLLCGFFLHCQRNGVRIDFTASFNHWRSIQLTNEKDTHEALTLLAGARQRTERSAQRLLERIARVSPDQRLFVVSNTPLEDWVDLMNNLAMPVVCVDAKTWRRINPVRHDPSTAVAGPDELPA